jgi:hypothetical protein
MAEVITHKSPDDRINANLGIDESQPRQVVHIRLPRVQRVANHRELENSARAWRSLWKLTIINSLK